MNDDESYDHEGSVAGYGDMTHPVSGVTNPIQIEQGNNFVLYLQQSGRIRSRGTNVYGQLGDGTNTDVSSGTTTVEVQGITTATKIEAGQWGGMALLSNGQVCVLGEPQINTIRIIKHESQ